MSQMTNFISSHGAQFTNNVIDTISHCILYLSSELTISYLRTRGFGLWNWIEIESSLQVLIFDFVPHPRLKIGLDSPNSVDSPLCPSLVSCSRRTCSKEHQQLQLSIAFGIIQKGLERKLRDLTESRRLTFLIVSWPLKDFANQKSVLKLWKSSSKFGRWSFNTV